MDMTPTTDLKEFLSEIAEAIRIKREEYDELYSPQEFSEKILDIETKEEVNIETASISFFSEVETGIMKPDSPPIEGLAYHSHYGGLTSISGGRENGAYPYWGNELPWLVKGSLLLVYASPSFIGIDGSSLLILQEPNFFIIQVKGSGNVYLYYNTGDDE